MGITGLLPFLEKASTRGNISQFAGGTVAIDSYCWLHKGAFACAEKLTLGEPTDAYVTYCMRYINMLLSHNIKPILVFDGCHLPAKKDTESKRRELREKNRKRAAELIRMGQVAEGKTLLRRSIDISHEMALNLIKVCHECNIDCIVAPYEADSQLAYLNLSGIADIIITEDSDLTLFGCKKIFFKMDLTGNGVLVEQERFYLAMGVRSEHFYMDKFRYMCILSGCDYLPSLPGIGLVKASKFIKKISETDMHKALTRLPSYLNMKTLDVSKEYRDAFLRADVTFKHQLVFCPFKRRQVRLTPPTPDVTPEQLYFAGKTMPDDLAWQLAIGNYDPMTLKKLHDYDPDTFIPGKTLKRTNFWEAKPVTKHKSIWSNDFKIKKMTPKQDKGTTLWPDTFGKVTVLKTTGITRPLMSPKRNYEDVDDMEPEELLKLYTNKEVDNSKRSCHEVDVSKLKLNTSALEEGEKSPILVRRANPFAKATRYPEVSPSLLDKGKKRSKFRTLARFQPTVIDNNVVTKSKFFALLTDASTKPSVENKITSDKVSPVKEGNTHQTNNPNTAETESFQLHDPIRSVNNVEHCEERHAKIDRANCKRINASDDRVEKIQKSVIIDESTCESESMCDSVLPGIPGASHIIEDSCPISSMDISDDVFYRDREIASAVSPEKHVHANGAYNPKSNSPKSNLNQWANPKINGSSALLSISSVRNPSNIVTLRGVQGAAKTIRVPRKSVNKKFQPVRKQTQVEQGQQSLLSSFGFQKKTGLQH